MNRIEQGGCVNEEVWSRLTAIPGGCLILAILENPYVPMRVEIGGKTVVRKIIIASKE